MVEQRGEEGIGGQEGARSTPPKAMTVFGRQAVRLSRSRSRSSRALMSKPTMQHRSWRSSQHSLPGSLVRCRSASRMRARSNSLQSRTQLMLSGQPRRVLDRNADFRVPIGISSGAVAMPMGPPRAPDCGWSFVP